MGKEVKNDIRWAVLGTGVIANEMAQALQKSGKKL
jgi:pyruvate/2-oxoglutarate dehydrogenase complex dihydrolipoamide dehydrogenase (E3) component